MYPATIDSPQGVCRKSRSFAQAQNSERLCCIGSVCQYPPCSGLGAKCDKYTKCCVHLSCQRSQCHTCFSLGQACDPKNNRCCDSLHCDKTNKMCMSN
uniref:Uncharacterized protein n=1 Tax=Meloidogyne incognita TaxID=6306 RepID=A0A914NW69_MELIC